MFAALFQSETRSLADQCDSGHDFFSTHFDSSYLPQTKPARKHFTKVRRKTLLTHMGAKPSWLFVRKTLFLNHNIRLRRWQTSFACAPRSHLGRSELHSSGRRRGRAWTQIVRWRSG